MNMRFKTLLLLGAFLLTLCATLPAQRYLKPVFNSVSKQTVVYGQNFTILTLSSPLMRTARQPLRVDIYTPTGDTEKKRPLIIYLSTGNFFPFPQNGSCGGTMTDSSNVEFATRLAKMGYVVAVAEYRLGWNPFSPQELTRRFTLINAAYRGVQDIRTCVRFFKRGIVENNNPYGVDANKIVVWGQGTGGYLSMAAAYLNTYNEILTTSDPNKFRLPSTSGPIPMVIEQYNGDVEGKTGPAIVDATYHDITGKSIPVGDTMAIANHTGYSSNFTLAVNMGGALGDSTWIDKGETPLISYHVPSDFFAPYRTDILNVPTGGGPQPVVEVSGSFDVQTAVNKLGLNNGFSDAAIASGNLKNYDKYGAIGKTRSGGLIGLYPFVGTPGNTSAPWEWTSAAGNPSFPLVVCNKNGAVARAYIDTIINFYAARAMLALSLTPFVGTEELVNNIEIGIAPNPATAQTVFTVPEEMPLTALEVFDISGRMVRRVEEINNHVYTLERNGLPRGMYLIKAFFKEGVASRKLMFE
jgi:hypothetical protein